MGVSAVKVIDMEVASGMDDLQQAAKHLQHIAGITTGDVAFQYITQEKWDEADRADRVELLRGWLKAEKAYEEVKSA